MLVTFKAKHFSVIETKKEGKHQHLSNLLFKKHFTIEIYAVKHKEAHICILKSIFLEEKWHSLMVKQ
jgi:hypothetical protein